MVVIYSWHEPNYGRLLVHGVEATKNAANGRDWEQKKVELKMWGADGDAKQHDMSPCNTLL